MSAEIPTSHKDLLERAIYTVLVTVMPDGQPQASIVWCKYDGAHIQVSTIRGRQKEKNMSARPMATLLALDPQDPFRFLEIRGMVDEMTEEGGVELINELSMAYVNQQFYGGYTSAERAGQEVRVVCKIKPKKVVAYPAG